MQQCARHSGLKFLCFLMICFFPIASFPARAEIARTPLLEFFERQGCTIGPESRQAARDAGFAAEEIDELAAAALMQDQASQEGSWLVLSSGICRIRPPELTSAASLTDPDVIRHFTRKDEYASQGEPGCFLVGDALREDWQQARGWDPEKAYQEYMNLLGASVISGELSLYSDDPIHTPPGIILMTGDCADIPEMPDIRRSQRAMLAYFDELVRESAARVDCGETGEFFSYELPQIAMDLSDGKITNAFIFMDMMFVTMAAGWTEGSSLTEKGKARPPLCHLE
ncbi:hypothetical protein [Paracoccus onubensis]|uniref:Uncharacterized protein n=1 Tax=Paracoccus onubensis TaxID=1675788 RepID=A0A418T4R9_9RHOB|nr:hypothetical protein [Paracoccus onubensis]RJE88203.1 hypothetical protein D3P04_04655 [Paracoccus onubensis]